MLTGLIKKNRSEFEIGEVLEPDFLKMVRRTTFAYTKISNGMCLAVDQKYFTMALSNHNIIAVIAPPSAILNKERYGKSIIVAQKAAELFYFLHNQDLDDPSKFDDASFEGYIDDSATIDNNAVLSEKVIIEKNVKISAGCVIRDYCIIGENTTIHPGAIVGADGVFAKDILGKKNYIKHYGGVRIGKDCVLHAGSVIVRSANRFEFTEISDNVHIGIRSSIGHDCHIGEGCDISSNVAVSGRVELGKKCWVGVGAVISNALKIGDSASIRIGAIVVENVESNGDVSGNFALNHYDNIKNFYKKKKH